MDTALEKAHWRNPDKVLAAPEIDWCLIEVKISYKPTYKGLLRESKEQICTVSRQSTEISLEA